MHADALHRESVAPLIKGVWLARRRMHVHDVAWAWHVAPDNYLSGAHGALRASLRDRKPQQGQSLCHQPDRTRLECVIGVVSCCAAVLHPPARANVR